MSISSDGMDSRRFNAGNRLCPPAISFASPPFWTRSAIASATDPART